MDDDAPRHGVTEHGAGVPVRPGLRAGVGPKPQPDGGNLPDQQRTRTLKRASHLTATSRGRDYKRRLRHEVQPIRGRGDHARTRPGWSPWDRAAGWGRIRPAGRLLPRLAED